MRLTKARSYQHASMWIGAVLVGGAVVLYARLVGLCQGFFFSYFGKYSYLISAAAPFAFLLAAAIVRNLAPDAKGSSIPQILEAIEIAKSPDLSEVSWASPSVSLRTALIKVGSGYEATQNALGSASAQDVSALFPLYKLATTTLSYLSGMAGGIFSPSLSIGAGLGLSIAKIAHFTNFRTCALMGMVAFFSGVVQAPLTAVIIVTEMTGRHILIIPFMVAAFLGQGVGRLLIPTPLYHYLAKRHEEG